MKKFRLLLAFIAMAGICRAQISWGRYSQSYSNLKGPQLIVAIPSENDVFWSNLPVGTLQMAYEKDESFKKNRPAEFVFITSFDQENAQFFVKDVAQGQQYEYRVLQDAQQTIVDWSPLTTPATDSVRHQSTLRDLMYIGGFHAPVGHSIVVDLRRKNKSNIISTVVVKWQPIRPSLLNIYTSKDLNGFQLPFTQPNGFRVTAEQSKRWKEQYGSENINDNGLPKKLVTAANDNSIVFVLSENIRQKEQLQIELVKDNKIIRPWEANEFDTRFIWLRDLAPGEYTLRIRFTAQPENTLEYNFKVQEPPGQSAIYLIGTGSLVAAFLALIVVITLYIRQKRKTRVEARQREKLEREMKGLKSQLNPHFIFNALNSIQGLVNTQRLHEANEYIALFAKMMRETLTLSNIDQAPLQQEINYLDAYLRLEQLRFNFAYSIRADPQLRTAEVNFPTLLLQPLAENAVKHGAANTNNGHIDLNFEKKNNDLVVTITDNGHGFDEAAKKEGYGLHLTKQRINLFSRQVAMHIRSGENGTQVQLTFKEWL